MKRLDEIKTISKEEQIVLMKCRRVIKRMESSAKVILYGSRVRDDASDDSDYDLLILIDGEVSLKKEDTIRRRLFPIELDTGCVFSVIMKSHSEWDTPLHCAMPFHQNIEREGVLL